MLKHIQVKQSQAAIVSEQINIYRYKKAYLKCALKLLFTIKSIRKVILKLNEIQEERNLKTNLQQHLKDTFKQTVSPLHGFSSWFIIGSSTKNTHKNSR